MNTSAPEEFKKVCRNLVQDLDLVVSTSEELMQVALLGIEPQERAPIKAFLDELLSGRYSDDQLKEIWWSMPSDIVFHEGKDVATFLTTLRDEVQKGACIERPCRCGTTPSTPPPASARTCVNSEWRIGNSE
jgi:hypothetical protein